MSTKQRKAITLIELVFAIAILAVLVAISIPKFINLRKNAQKAACQGSASAIQTALSNYYTRKAMAGTAVFPDSLHEASFITYLAKGTLPSHPASRDWQDYYTTISDASKYTFSIGKGAASGVCTAF